MANFNFFSLLKHFWKSFNFTKKQFVKFDRLTLLNIDRPSIYWTNHCHWKQMFQLFFLGILHDFYYYFIAMHFLEATNFLTTTKRRKIKKRELEGRKREPHRESFQMGRERSLRSFVPIDEITGHRSIP